MQNSYATRSNFINTKVYPLIRSCEEIHEMLHAGNKFEVPNSVKRKKIQVGITDVFEQIATMKFNWASYVARVIDGKWTKAMLEWRPRQEAGRSKDHDELIT